MAETAAHFTATLEAKPSIFEVIAQHSLNSTLQPAFQRIARFLASANPRKFYWVSDYHEEVFLILNGLLQYHYLRTTSASFSEYFYGLRRAPVNSNSSMLLDYQKKLSLLVLVILPYMKQKLKERLQIYRLENAEGSLKMNLEGTCKRIALVSYSLSEIVFGFWTVAQYLRYMSDKTVHQTPWLQLLHLKLTYSLELENTTGFWAALFRGQLTLSELSKGLFHNTIQSFLELSAFSIQFLQVWYAEHSNYSFGALPTVVPPPHDNKASSYKGKCPLCLQNWKVPSVLPISGYVFCFPCIVWYLRDHQCCPVTKFPAKPLDIVRLYDSN